MTMTSKRTTTAVVAGLCGVTVVALIAVFGFGGGDSKSKAGGSGGGGTSGGAAAASSSAPPVTPQSVAQAFLDAWAAGDWAKAAALTDTPDKASAGLKNEMAALAPQKITLTLGQQADASSSGPATPVSSSGSPTAAGTPTAAAAPTLARYSFAVNDDFGNNLAWQYQSSLGLVQGPAGTPVVQWSYAVIHPSLSSKALLKAAPPKVTVTDAAGGKIDTTAHPSLLNAVNALATKLPPGQTPQALTVEFTDAHTGAQIQGSQSFQIGAASTAPTAVKTTLKPAVQSAMEKALKDYPDSAMVAIQPSTGAILGMAANSPSNLSMAYQAARAPGSTFKVLTTALALQKGIKPGDPVDCSPFATVEGLRIDNDSDLKNGIPGAALKEAFLQSCNTAFVNLAVTGKLGSDYSALTNEAKDYFGLNQKWDLGMGAATYGTGGDQQVPPADGKGLFARDAFGQGNLTMSPLIMASVAATVAAHQFHQPFLVDGVPKVSATPLPDTVATQLTTLMQGVASSGTAAGVFPGLSGIAAKTGSAESNDTAKTHKTDSWMVAFDPAHDIAFAALVLNGGFGRDAAGPAINKVLHSPGVR
jgi:hypothetical protein